MRYVPLGVFVAVIIGVAKVLASPVVLAILAVVLAVFLFFVVSGLVVQHRRGVR